MKMEKFLHDIVNREYYQQILQSDNFLKSPFKITFTMNTNFFFIKNELLASVCYN